jgi:L-fucose mutarotase
MLIGINPILTPSLLKILAEMGHGDTLVIADANFPAASNARHLIELPGLSAPQVLAAVLTLFPLDTFVPHPAMIMRVVDGHNAQPEAITEFKQRIPAAQIEDLERHTFYARAREAYAIIATGESRPYGNIILTKGVIF